MFIVTSTHARDGKMIDAQCIDDIASLEEAELIWNQIRRAANAGHKMYWHTQMSQSPELYWKTEFIFGGHDTWNVTIFQTL